MIKKISLISARFKLTSNGSGSEKLSDLQTTTRDRIKNLIASSIWIESERDCPICNGSELIQVAQIDRYLLPVSTAICKQCGFMFTNSVMREEDYTNFYINYYRELYTNSAHVTKYFFEHQLKTGERIYKYLSNFLDLKSKKIVEIGAGAGGILKAFENKGIEVEGCDFGEEYLSYGRGKNLNLIYGDISKIADKSADVVIYCHVLEHILDLDHEFENIKRILKPGGLVYVEVPGIYFIHYTYRGNFLKFLQNAHLYHFSRKTLSNLMKKNGFTALAVNEKIIGLFALNKNSTDYKFTPSNYLFTIIYLKLNETLRFFLMLPWIFYDLFKKLK